MFARFLAAASALALAAACSQEAAAPVADAAMKATDATMAVAESALSAPADMIAAATAPSGSPLATPAAMTAPSGASTAATAPMDNPAPPPAASASQPPVLPIPASVAVTNYKLPIKKIANFKLKDQHGKTHELYKMTDAKLVVLTMHTKGCPIGQQLMPDFNDLHAKYEAKGVKFVMMNSNSYDTPAMIAQEAKDFGTTIPILKDADQAAGFPLGVERSTETLIIEPGTWKILYQGPINDRVTYGRARAKADVHYASDVMDAVLAGKTIIPSYVAPEGCILVFDKRS